MKTNYFAIMALTLVTCAHSIAVNINPRAAREAPPEILAQARDFVAKKDFAGIEGMIAQADAKYANNHGPDYFRVLLGIKDAVDSLYIRASKSEFPRYWLARKITWKVLLTPYSRIEDAAAVQGMKNFVTHVGTPVPIFDFDESHDQFVALRQDSVALVKAYANILRAGIIPGYRNKPGRQNHAGRVGPLKEEEVAREKEKEPELIRNEYENTEQRELNSSLSLLSQTVVDQIQYDFSWPPEDDAAVADLFDALPSLEASKDRILAELVRLRGQKLEDIKRMEAKRKAALEKEPAGGDGKK